MIATPTTAHTKRCPHPWPLTHTDFISIQTSGASDSWNLDICSSIPAKESGKCKSPRPGPPESRSWDRDEHADILFESYKFRSEGEKKVQAEQGAWCVSLSVPASRMCPLAFRSSPEQLTRGTDSLRREKGGEIYLWNFFLYAFPIGQVSLTVG